MAWDERGRLWVIETLDYPNNKRPLGEGNDKVKILEDSDGDGRADVIATYADGKISRTEQDDDFDGVFEKKVASGKGGSRLQEVDKQERDLSDRDEPARYAGCGDQEHHCG